MRRLWLALLWLVGCVPLQEETRVERGPLLRSFERHVELGNRTLQAQVDPKWPELQISFLRYDTCRTEKVNEYAEDHITERSARGAGPAIALGICGTLAGGGLLAARPLFSGEPNRRVIDASGHYGASSRQLATGWGIGALIVGVPALAVGLIEQGRSGERVRTVTGEQVVSSRDALCKPEPVDGSVDFLAGPGPRQYRTQGARITLTPEQVAELGDFTSNLNGEPVFWSREEDDELNAYRACVRVLPVPPPETLGAMAAHPLRTRLDLLEACGRVAPEAAADARPRYEAALEEAVRRERPRPALIGPRLESWHDVEQLYGPRRRVAEGTADALALSRGELQAGEAVRMLGVVRSRTTVELALVNRPNGPTLVPLRGVDEAKLGEVLGGLSAQVAQLLVGEQEVLVLLEPGAVWEGAVRGGAQLELIGTVRRAEDAVGRPLPLVEAHWARAAE